MQLFFILLLRGIFKRLVYNGIYYELSHYDIVTLEIITELWLNSSELLK
jgi:hypothetical protein